MLRRFLNSPWFNVALFAFLLNFVWEMLQIGFYEEMVDIKHGRGVFICTLATLGDVVIAMAAFEIVARRAEEGRLWIVHIRPWTTAGFTATALSLAVVAEWLLARKWELWTYDEAMPAIPILRVGIAVILQWLVLAPLIVWFTRRQMLGALKS